MRGLRQVKALFEKLSDSWPDGTVEALVVNDRYLKLSLTSDLGVVTSAEVFPYEATSPEGARVALVRVQSEGKAVPVLVSPVPSAVLAVILR